MAKEKQGLSEYVIADGKAMTVNGVTYGPGDRLHNATVDHLGENLGRHQKAGRILKSPLAKSNAKDSKTDDKNLEGGKADPEKTDKTPAGNDPNKNGEPNANGTAGNAGQANGGT